MHVVDPASDACIGLTRTATWTDDDDDDDDSSSFRLMVLIAVFGILYRIVFCGYLNSFQVKNNFDTEIE